jgi:hypothetical protein
VAIGISPSGLATSGPGAAYQGTRLRAPAEPREDPREQAADSAARAVEPVGAPAEREARFARVERLGAAAPYGGGARGISAYLGVEQGALDETAGGELVGIDFYV